MKKFILLSPINIISKKKSLFVLLYVLLNFFLYPTTYSQSVGVRLGSSYISNYLYYTNYGGSKYFDVPVKNVLIEYNQNVFSDYQIKISVGYGWSNYKSHEQVGVPGSQFSYSQTFEVKSNGIPLELGVEYHKNLNADSTIEAIIGLGIGYCNYRSNYKVGYSYIYESNWSVKGFSQFINIGLLAHISNKISCFIDMKKMILNSLQISGDLNALMQVENSSFTQDYASSTGLFDVGLDIGINYKF